MFNTVIAVFAYRFEIIGFDMLIMREKVIGSRPTPLTFVRYEFISTCPSVNIYLSPSFRCEIALGVILASVFFDLSLASASSIRR